MNIAGEWRGMGHVKCFPVVQLCTLLAIVDQMCRGPVTVTMCRGIG